MNRQNEMQLSIKSDTFSAMKEDFDAILGRTIGNMQMKGAEDATITLKLSVSLENTNAVIGGESTDITRPSFKHDISSVMQVKDKKSGALTGDYQLVWDDEEGKYIMKKIENGQVTMFDQEMMEANGEVMDEDSPQLKGKPLMLGSSGDTEKTPFGWMKQFVGTEMKVTESMGNYTVRTEENKVLLSSAASPDNVFYCSKEVLEPHAGHKIACVGYGDNGETLSVTIECEDCNEVLFTLDAPVLVTEESEDVAEPATFEEDAAEPMEIGEDVAEVVDDEEDYEYDTPEADL